MGDFLQREQVAMKGNEYGAPEDACLLQPYSMVTTFCVSQFLVLKFSPVGISNTPHLFTEVFSHRSLIETGWVMQVHSS